ncbi:hypothetical protein BDK51DRAFT_30320 [Blyttiomyces helicus]|uniref:Uncharacterized protein n=1 Tax=Blyttiomyces helicus TaxID=388810 RepID=A0A4P9WNG7_9FUNG|nr:hypothetical protein BDK51DRAFT_30320 [Blyttiomyces helicus]|eukprot:RKO93238.1 hypothetical protein BDK51DRAFT_30320 [Blyttiomyces helicus]
MGSSKPTQPPEPVDQKTADSKKKKTSTRSNSSQLAPSSSTSTGSVASLVSVASISSAKSATATESFAARFLSLAKSSASLPRPPKDKQTLNEKKKSKDGEKTAKVTEEPKEDLGPAMVPQASSGHRRASSSGPNPTRSFLSVPSHDRTRTKSEGVVKFEERDPRAVAENSPPIERRERSKSEVSKPTKAAIDAAPKKDPSGDKSDANVKLGARPKMQPRGDGPEIAYSPRAFAAPSSAEGSMRAKRPSADNSSAATPAISQTPITTAPGPIAPPKPHKETSTSPGKAEAPKSKERSYKPSTLPQGTSLRVIKPHESKESEEISIAVDDVLELDLTPASDTEFWWYGTNRSWGPANGEQGFFPADCVELENWEPPPKVPAIITPLETTAAGVNEDPEAALPQPVPPGTKVIAREPYEPTKSDELELCVGDVVIVTEAPDGGWWKGTSGLGGNDDKSGWFPATLVSIEGQTPKSDPTPLLPVADCTKVIVREGYEPTKADELALEIGDRVVVVESPEGGWWRGTKISEGESGKTGWFPASIVAIEAPKSTTTTSAPPSPSVVSPEVPAPSPSPPKAGTQVVVRESFVPSKADELTLHVGDIVVVIESPDGGWWKGATGLGGKDAKTGWFPAALVDFNSPKPTTPCLKSPPQSTKPPKLKTQLVSQPQADSKPQDIKPGTASSQKAPSQSTQSPKLPTQHPPQPHADPKPRAIKPGTKAVVRESYVPAKADELTLHVGDAVVVTEGPEGGWWKGMTGLSGKAPKTGWFPSELVHVEPDASAKSIPDTSNAPQPSLSLAPEPPSSPTARMPNPGAKVKALVRESYVPSKADELVLHVGDIVIVTETPEGGWWKGTTGTGGTGGKEPQVGWFPMALVELEDASPEPISPQQTSPGVITPSKDGSAEPTSPQQTSPNIIVPSKDTSARPTLPHQTPPEIIVPLEDAERTSLQPSSPHIIVPDEPSPITSHETDTKTVSKQLPILTVVVDGDSTPETTHPPEMLSPGSIEDTSRSLESILVSGTELSAQFPAHHQSNSMSSSLHVGSASGGPNSAQPGANRKSWYKRLVKPSPGTGASGGGPSGTVRVRSNSAPAAPLSPTQTGVATSLATLMDDDEEEDGLESSIFVALPEQALEGDVKVRHQRSSSAPPMPIHPNQESILSPVDAWQIGMPDEVLERMTHKEKQRMKAVWELIMTEKDYVRDLTIIIECFIHPLAERKIISAKIIANIFSNIEQLLPINQKLLELIEGRVGVNTLGPRIGDIFIQTGDSLVAYTQYCSNQAAAAAKITALMQSKKEFRQFLEEAHRQPFARQLDLASFLIKPVQRLCKYPLLIRHSGGDEGLTVSFILVTQEILKNTEESNPDFHALKDALDHINGIITIVNEGARQTEGLRSNAEIQASFVDRIDITTANRTFIREDAGSLVYSDGSKKPRRMLLFSDLLIIARKDWRDKYHLECRAVLKNCRVAEVSDDAEDSFAIEIEVMYFEASRTPKRYLFCMASASTRSSWVLAYRNLTQSKVSSKRISEAWPSQLTGGEQEEPEEEVRSPTRSIMETPWKEELTEKVLALEKRVAEDNKKLQEAEQKAASAEARATEIEAKYEAARQVADAAERLRQEASQAENEAKKFKEEVEIAKKALEVLVADKRDIQGNYEAVFVRLKALEEQSLSSDEAVVKLRGELERAEAKMAAEVESNQIALSNERKLVELERKKGEEAVQKERAAAATAKAALVAQYEGQRAIDQEKRAAESAALAAEIQNVKEKAHAQVQASQKETRAVQAALEQEIAKRDTALKTLDEDRSTQFQRAVSEFETMKLKYIQNQEGLKRIVASSEEKIKELDATLRGKDDLLREKEVLLAKLAFENKRQADELSRMAAKEMDARSEYRGIVANFERILQERNQTVEKREADASELARKVTELTERALYLQAEVEKVSRDANEHKRLLEESNLRLKEEAAARVKDQAQLQELDRVHRDVCRTLEQAKTQNAGLSEANRRIGSESSRAKEIINKQGQQLAQAAQETKIMAGQITELQNSIKRWEKEVADLHAHEAARDAAAREMLARKEEECHQAILQAERSQAKVEELQLARVTHMRESDELRADYQRQLALLKKRTDEAEEEMRIKHERELREAVSRQAASEHARHEQLVAESEELRDSLEAARSRLALAEKDAQTMRSRIDSYKDLDVKYSEIRAEANKLASIAREREAELRKEQELAVRRSRELGRLHKVFAEIVKAVTLPPLVSGESRLAQVPSLLTASPPRLESEDTSPPDYTVDEHRYVSVFTKIHDLINENERLRSEAEVADRRQEELEGLNRLGEQELEAAIAAARRVEAKSKERSRRYREESSRLRETVEQLQLELHEARANRGGFERSEESIKKDKAILEKQFVELFERLQKAQETYGAEHVKVTGEVAALQKELEITTASRDHAISVAETATKRLREAELERTHIRQLTESLTETKQKTQELLDVANGTSAALAVELDQAREQVDDARAEIEELMREREQTDRKFVDQQMALRRDIQDIASTGDQIHSQAIEIARLNGLLQQRENTLDSLSEEADGLRAARQEAEDRAAYADECLVEAEKRLDEAESTAAQLDARNSELASDVQRLLGEVQWEQIQRNAAERALAALRGQTASLQAILGTLQERIVRSDREISIWKDRRGALNTASLGARAAAAAGAVVRDDGFVGAEEDDETIPNEALRKRDELASLLALLESRLAGLSEKHAVDTTNNVSPISAMTPDAGGSGALAYLVLAARRDAMAVQVRERAAEMKAASKDASRARLLLAEFESIMSLFVVGLKRRDDAARVNAKAEDGRKERGRARSTSNRNSSPERARRWASGMHNSYGAAAIGKDPAKQESNVGTSDLDGSEWVTEEPELRDINTTHQGRGGGLAGEGTRTGLAW